MGSGEKAPLWEKVKMLGKKNILLLVVPDSYTGTFLYCMGARFPGANGDSSPGDGDECWLWGANSWVLGWSSYISEAIL